MKFGKIIGQVISTRNEGNITGRKLAVVRHLDEKLQDTDKTDVYIDTVKANPGDIVLLCTSSSARLTQVTRNVCTDSAIIGIVETISKGKENWYTRQNDKNHSRE
jgi:microcompartment protein CcmK/EutM